MGNLPIVEKNFNKVIYLIILVSIMPGIIEFVKARRAAVRVAR